MPSPILLAGANVALQLARNALQSRAAAGTRAVVKKLGQGAAAAAPYAVQGASAGFVQSSIDYALGTSQRLAGVPQVTIPSSMPGAPGAVRWAGRRYRRMNVCNVKALRRAGRRLSGFSKLAKGLVKLEEKNRIKKRRRR